MLALGGVVVETGLRAAESRVVSTRNRLQLLKVTHLRVVREGVSVGFGRRETGLLREGEVGLGRGVINYRSFV